MSGEYEITFKVRIPHVDGSETNELEELKKTVDHHIERLVNLEEWPCIKDIYDCNMKEI